MDYKISAFKFNYLFMLQYCNINYCIDWQITFGDMEMYVISNGACSLIMINVSDIGFRRYGNTGHFQWRSLASLANYDECIWNSIILPPSYLEEITF